MSVQNCFHSSVADVAFAGSQMDFQVDCKNFELGFFASLLQI